MEPCVIDEEMGELIHHHDIAPGIDVDESDDPRDEDAGVAKDQYGPTAAELPLVAHAIFPSDARKGAGDKMDEVLDDEHELNDQRNRDEDDRDQTEEILEDEIKSRKRALGGKGRGDLREVLNKAHQ